MKKWIGFLMICCVLCSTGAIGAQESDIAGTVYEKSVFRLMSIGVMEGYEDGTFRPEAPVTRAEMAVVAVRMLGISNIAPAGNVFADVSADNWAAGDIETAAALGLIQGTGGGNFAPEEPVRYEEAIKILVELLGYGPLAWQQGGYPTGYISQAASIGLLRGTQGAAGQELTRGMVALLAERAMDIELLEKTVGTGAEYQASGETLYERISSREELQQVRGVLSATEHAALEGYAPSADGFVNIDGSIYRVGASRAEEYLGYYVEAYIRSEEGDDPCIISIRPYGNRNETVTLAADKIRSATKTEILTEKGEYAQERFQIAPDATFLYNGKPVPCAEVEDELVTIYQGDVTLVSRDGTGTYDMVSVCEWESFIIDRVVEVNTAVYFKTGNTFRGKDGYRFRFDDSEIKTRLLDTEGNAIAFESLQAGDVISLRISLDETQCTAVVSRKNVEGTVTELGEDGEVSIDGKTYRLHQNGSGNYGYIPELQEKTTFLLDAQDTIVGTNGVKETAYGYGYVAEAGMAGGMGGYQLKIASCGSRQKKIEKEDNVETIYYTFQNQALQVLDTADSVILNGTRVSAAQLAEKGLAGNAVRYRLNSAGKIKEIDLYKLPAVPNPYDFNAELLSFGGYTAYEGFLADESTKVILTPNTPSCDEDYLVDVEITDKDNVKAFPVEIDEDTQVAEAVVLWANMDAKTPRPIRDTVKVSIVGKVIHSTAQDGSAACKVQMLTDKEEVYAISQDGDANFTAVTNLKKGDLIRYNEKSNGHIDNVEVLASIAALGDDYYRAYENSPKEELFGIVKSIRLNRLSNIRNEMVDELVAVLDENGTGQGIQYSIARKDGPQVYLYDRKEGNIYVSSTDEILGYEAAGTGASKVFMFVKNNDPSVVVIIRD